MNDVQTNAPNADLTIPEELRRTEKVADKAANKVQVAADLNKEVLA